ncbi:hypothetical protein, partial [Halorubrum sp. SP3]|uniref:hypothetical protein n=1 Tax=Halorubrum sp. SP3 TaxID=1537265 RepID=UPI001A7E0759
GKVLGSGVLETNVTGLDELPRFVRPQPPVAVFGSEFVGEPCRLTVALFSRGGELVENSCFGVGFRYEGTLLDSA